MIRTIYALLYPLAWALTWSLKGFFPKIQKGFELRALKQGTPPWVLFPQHTQPIWIHCQSGEFEYALPVIREIKSQTPHIKIVVTYYTPSYIERIEKESLVDFSCPLPWDTAKDVSSFISHHKPQQLLIARTGLWPEVLHQCRKNNIPVSLFSMTFSKKLNFWNTLYYRWIFSFISHFFVVSSQDQENLLRIDPQYDITVTGDTRYEQCLYRLQQAPPVKLNKSILDKKIFIAASTWPEDENVLLPFIQKNSLDYHWIIVPHEFDESHLKSIRQQLNPLNPVLYSEVKIWNGQTPLIVDQFGLLAPLYGFTDAAFIGGSFKSRVHSVMESLACGNITYVGPFHTNNREALEFKTYHKTSIPPVQVIDKAIDLEKIHEQIQLWSDNDKNILKQEILSKSHVSQKLVSNLFEKHPPQ